MWGDARREGAAEQRGEEGQAGEGPLPRLPTAAVPSLLCPAHSQNAAADRALGVAPRNPTATPSGGAAVSPRTEAETADRESGTCPGKSFGRAEPELRPLEERPHFYLPRRDHAS